jgi:hypothetical protein
MNLKTVINIIKGFISPQILSSSIVIPISYETTLETIQDIQKTLVVENG